MELANWAKAHVTSLAAMRGEEIQIEETAHGFVAGGHHYYIVPQLGVRPHDDPETKATIVTLNTPANIDVLVSHWDSYCELPKLRVLFVNPDTNEHWSINPFLHDRITERKALKKGLQSIASTTTYST